MKKQFIFAGMLTSIVATAQDYDKRVGINTTEPRATLEVFATSNGKAEGILYPQISETEKNAWKKNDKKGLVAGTMIWNLNKICLDYFDGTIWQCTDGTKKNTHGTPWTIYSELAVASLGFNGTFKQGTSLSGSTVKFKLTNRTGSALNNLDLTDAVSVVNNGASITAVGQNANNISIPNGESVEITYNLSGTPNTGDLTATFTYQGQSATAQTTVASKTLAEIMQNVNVVVGTPAGTYKDGTALTSSNTVSVTLTNNGNVALSNADLRNALSITNTGATITATASANANPVTLAPGQSITLTYTLGGTPKEGTLTANFSYEGKEASNYTTVAEGEKIPTYPSTEGTLTVSAGKYTIFSMYDNDYFPYTAPASTAVASWDAKAAGGGNETLIDIQGTIPATGLTVKIPITYIGSDTTLTTFTSNAVAIDPKGEQGVTNSTRKLILSWEQQTITSSTTYITAKITPEDGQILNVTKLDLNAGLGGDFSGPKLVEFSLPASTNTTTKVPYAIYVIPGIPDRYFGQADKLHDFIYLPVMAEDGKIWLNNNLGADYSKYGGDYFDPAQQATSRDDWKAYGSLFQWQRKADGHELIVRSASNTTGTPKYTGTGSVVSTWDAGTEKRFIPYNSSSDYSWTTATSPLDLWQSNQSNNPCPVGFHVPTKDEWSNLQTKSGGSHNYDWWAGTSKLRLPAAGYRYYYNGSPNYRGSYGAYWSSSPYAGSGNSHAFYFNSSGSNTGNDYRADGFSVRCLSD